MNLEPVGRGEHLLALYTRVDVTERHYARPSHQQVVVMMVVIRCARNDVLVRQRAGASRYGRHEMVPQAE
jgi:hypothetical protein